MNGLIFKIKMALEELKGNDKGVGVVEVILLLVILIAIVLIFKTQITNIVTNAFHSINNDSGAIIS